MEKIHVNVKPEYKEMIKAFSRLDHRSITSFLVKAGEDRMMELQMNLNKIGGIKMDKPKADETDLGKCRFSYNEQTKTISAVCKGKTKEGCDKTRKFTFPAKEAPEKVVENELKDEE